MNQETITYEELAEQAAIAILEAFDFYHRQFKTITLRAQSRFSQQDWQGARGDSVERLELYNKVINQIVVDIRLLLEQETKNRLIWGKMKSLYLPLIAKRDDFELAATFFNSVTRHIFATVGVDSVIEYTNTDFQLARMKDFKPVYQIYPYSGSTNELIEQILQAYDLEYRDMALDAESIAEKIRSYLATTWNSTHFYAIEVVRSLFFRDKAAYIIGRIRRASYPIPLVLVLRHSEEGVFVDAVLLNENDVSIVFSFTRSYFHVEVNRSYELVSFLKSIMPWKRIAELYTSIGYNKHGKTMLYQDLLNHLARSDEKFELARGARGMVMEVFAMPSYDVVFKIIKDKFERPKKSTRQEVMNKYQLVFKHDRAGRLADAQEYEHLKFEKKRFSEQLLEELLKVAPSSVTVEGDYVSIKHLYTERKMIPLNIYLHEAKEEDARHAIIDYGNALKDLAASRIFAGDLLLKNFGVTRHKRVIFYDYDELSLLTDCHFRRIPPPRNEEDEFSAEPWYYVAENDIFPEEFYKYLAIPRHLRDVFISHHKDLLDVEYWQTMQQRHKVGEIIEILPY